MKKLDEHLKARAQVRRQAAELGKLASRAFDRGDADEGNRILLQIVELFRDAPRFD